MWDIENLENQSAFIFLLCQNACLSLPRKTFELLLKTLSKPILTWEMLQNKENTEDAKFE